MERTIKIKEKDYTIKELKYLDFADQVDDSLPKREKLKLMLKLASGMTDEEVESLTFQEGIQLQTAINEVNGLGFQQIKDLNQLSTSANTLDGPSET